jgi:Domain of unknown function (DUF929)
VPPTFTNAPQRARRVVGAILAGLVCALALGYSASAAPTSTPPRAALLRALSQVHRLGTHASNPLARHSADAVSQQLARALDRVLWLDPSEVVAPPDGARVFSDTSAALTELQGVSGPRAARAASAGGLIVRATRGLAADILAQAAGGDPSLLATAARDIAAGDHAAQAGRRTAATRSYAAAWAAASEALRRQVTAEITRVPAATLAAAAEDALGSRRIGLAGPMIQKHWRPLTRAGKPELFFAGAEGCPFCAVQRWGMIAALAQFGTFSKLHLMQSDTTEPPPVRTFTFYGSSYHSPYLAFVPVEILGHIRHGQRFPHLQHPTAAEWRLIHRFDRPAETPFIDVAGHFIQVSSTVDPHLIGGLTWAQVAGSFGDPNSIAAQTIAGEAEVLTAELCVATGGRPASVCSATVVTQYEAALPLLDGHGGGCPLAAADRPSAGHDGPRARPARCNT